MNNKQKLALLVIFLAGVIIRFYKLSSNPPGLYWDEAAFGYDAFSVLRTTMDHHGHVFPLFFESFGDWKLPGYFYLLIPSIKFFGLNEFAVRLPSALLGSLTIPIFFLLIRKLTSNINLSLFSSSFLALSPWHIQFSRGGFESTAGLFFVTSGIYLFLVALDKKNKITLSLSLILLTFSMYTYHAYRIFVPLLTLAILIILRDKIKKNLSLFVIPAIIAFILFLPLLKFSFTANGQSRAASQSVFKDSQLDYFKKEYDQKSKKPLRFLSKYIYNKPLYFLYLSFNGYIDHFSPVFLFYQGDQIGRHSQVDSGQIYIFESLFLIAAVLAFKKQKKKSLQIMLFWLILSPIPAVIVSPTPHAYRTLQMAPALAFFSGLGAYYIYSRKGLFAVKALLMLIVIFYVSSYTHMLFNHYPKKFAADWQDGYRDMVKNIVQYQDSYDKVYVTNINQVPYIYLLFYTKYSPQKFIDSKGTKDSFDKYVFISPDFDPYNKGRILYVAPSWQKVDGKWLSAVNDSAGRHIYSLWEVGND